MAESTILIVIGALLTLIGILGGGFEIKEAKIPKVGLVPRVMALVIGMAILTIQLYPKSTEGESPQVESGTENSQQESLETRLAEALRGIEAQKDSLAQERRQIEIEKDSLAKQAEQDSLAEEWRRIEEKEKRLAEIEDSLKKALPETVIATPPPKPKPRQLSGVYTIQQKSNGRYVDAHENRINDYRLVTRPAQNNDTQRWVLTPLGNNTYTIQQKSNGRYVDAHENRINDYRLVTRPAQNNDTQRWVLTPLGNNTYTIQQKSNGRYVDAHETSNNDYRLVTRPAQNNDTQRWLINPL